jgi:hypothetical protein
MGCDIHATLEYDKWNLKRLDEPKYWISFAKDIDIDRGYYLFGILAGVRNGDINPISEPKGVPDDASYKFMKEYEEWGADAHTPSWVSYKELNDWKLKTGEFEFDPESDFKKEDFFKVMEILAKQYGEENVRLVFFFDN